MPHLPHLPPRGKLVPRRPPRKAAAARQPGSKPDIGREMLRRTYEWMMRLAGSPDAPAWLALLAFAEGVFFPVPPDVLLMPLVLASRERAWRYALICLSASVLGG